MPVVSEEMVERALEAAPRFWRDTANCEKHIRACLTAALSDQVAGEKEPTGIVRRIGWMRNKDIDPGDDTDGRFLGVVIEYPNDPPAFSPRVVWDKTPVRVVIAPPSSPAAGE